MGPSGYFSEFFLESTKIMFNALALVFAMGSLMVQTGWGSARAGG